MAHATLQALGAFMNSHSVADCTKSWGTHEHNQQFGENNSIDIRKSQRLRTKDNARINKVSAMRQGLAKIIEKVLISRTFEKTETDLCRAEIACWIYYADTRSLKPVY